MVSLCFSTVLNTEIIYLKNMFLTIIVNKFKPFAIFATPKDRRSELNCVSWAMDDFFLCHEHLQRNEAFSIKRISFKMKKFNLQRSSALCCKCSGPQKYSSQMMFSHSKMSICKDMNFANASDTKNIHGKWYTVLLHMTIVFWSYYLYLLAKGLTDSSYLFTKMYLQLT